MKVQRRGGLGFCSPSISKKQEKRRGQRGISTQKFCAKPLSARCPNAEICGSVRERVWRLAKSSADRNADLPILNATVSCVYTHQDMDIVYAKSFAIHKCHGNMLASCIVARIQTSSKLIGHQSPYNSIWS